MHIGRIHYTIYVYKCVHIEMGGVNNGARFS